MKLSPTAGSAKWRALTDEVASVPMAFLFFTGRVEKGEWIPTVPASDVVPQIFFPKMTVCYSEKSSWLAAISRLEYTEPFFPYLAVRRSSRIETELSRRIRTC